ncbi:MAG TPA: Gfo/Idh/MocA family oxidoreductase [Gemmataceae bacterium]|nr:Gfo/Idh/MocA family oxidoreductase [Gemmataceae bacterium]
MARLRMAVIGVGHLGKEHARILAGLPDVELVGVADVNANQAEAVARRLNCRAYVNYRPLLHLADAAVIAVPTSHHYTIAGEFLRCGIPLLVEKPLAANLEQAETLVDLSHQNRVLLQVGHIERFNPAFEQLQSHALQPKFVECERLGAFSGRSMDIGVVLDLMIHDLDILLTLVQAPIRSVESLGVAVFGDNEDVANARLTFANGCVANVTASRASAVTHRQMRIWAPEGYTTLDFAKRRLSFVQPTQELRRHGLNPRKLDPAALAMLKNDLFGRYLQHADLECDTGSDSLTRELQHFIHCVQTDSCPRVSGEDGRNAVALAMRILEGVQAHQWEGHAEGPTGPAQLPPPRGELFQPPARELAA